MTREFDMFEQLVCDALQSDAQPSSDFAAAVMARVAQTPQRKPIRYGRIATGLAACLVVAFIATIPLRWRAGSAAPKDAAAPQAIEESMVMNSADSGSYEAAAEEAPAAGSQSSTTSNSVYDTYGGVEASKQAAAERVDSDESRSVPTYRVTDSEVCRQVEAWLADHGYSDDGGYVLHLDDVVRLNAAVEGLGLPECDCVLILSAD